MTNISIPMANMLKNSRTLAVSFAINISIKLCFVSVNGHRETCFVDEPRTSLLLAYLKLEDIPLKSNKYLIFETRLSLPAPEGNCLYQEV
jgi:hypothetical protein